MSAAIEGERNTVLIDDLDAYGTISVAGDVADLERIAVMPSRRRQGVARQLLDALCAAAGAQGATRMLLEVAADNEAALGFYDGVRIHHDQPARRLLPWRRRRARHAARARGGPMRQNFSSPSPFEDVVGYSRAVRIGDSAWVAGTTATVEGEVVGVGDAYEQTRVAFGIALAALATAGMETQHVVRTRMYVTDIADFDEVGRAHKEIFDAVRPVATMVQVVALARPEHLVEVEIDAHVAS